MPGTVYLHLTRRCNMRLAVNAIGELLKKGVKPSINITLTSLNCDGIEYFIQYMLHEWGNTDGKNQSGEAARAGKR